MKKRSNNVSGRIFCLCVIGGSVLAGLLFLAIQLRLMGVQVLRDYGEGHTLWMSQQVTNLAISYKPLDRLPYVIFPYPPLYLIVSKIVSFGTGSLLLAGRSVSLVSTFGLAAVIAMLIFRSIPSSFPSLWRLASGALGAALVLSTGSVIGWASLMRVDMLGMLLMYAGLTVYILSGKREPGQYFAMFLFVLAAFAKQTLLSAPIACAVFGLFAYPKTTFRVCVFALLLGLLGLAVCYWLTDGGFLKNILSYNLNPFSWEVVAEQFSSHLRSNMLPKLLLSAAAIITFWNGKRIRRIGLKRFILLKSNEPYARTIIIGSINALFAGLLAISIGKMGSIYNFFLAWDISLCLLAVLLLFRLLATLRTNQRVKIYRLLLLPVLFLLFIPSRWVISLVTEDFYGKIQEEAQIIRLIHATPGPILSDNMLVITKAGRKIEAEPATLSFLTLAGGWDESPYLHLFDRGYFSLIVTTQLLGSARYSPAVVSSIEKNYRLEGEIGSYLIYRPRAATK
ncbi:hypothetical protein [Dyadobacter sp. CY326]|uniref:hypothetical protein n=1 Tax=Dyadobacter sp. CY326 TaxID=2907300 RepID=UPI001F385803|nr:hypothetical protein [Dyadobacter sp. CY326]MCE7065079.1 hypothetical protein [Dyadobacter sp. CY326]